MAVASSGHNRPTEATPQAALEAVTSTTSAVACAMAETRKTSASHSSGLDNGDEVTVGGGRSGAGPGVREALKEGWQSDNVTWVTHQLQWNEA